MRRRARTVTATLLLVIPSATGQTVSRAYAGEDGKAHLVYLDGVERAVPPEQQQVGCDGISVTQDGCTVDWSVLVENCCTSYPIPVSIVVYRDGKKSVISPPQMIHKWRFMGRGDRLAVLFGPAHGYASGASVYGSGSGKLAAWRDGKGETPKWAKGWEVEFEH